MVIQLENMSLPELRAHRDAVDTAIQKRKETDKQDALAKLKAVAAESGYSLEELVKDSKRSSKSDRRSAVAVKYRHPEDSSFTWTGRGKTPKWVIEWEASGKSRDALL